MDMSIATTNQLGQQGETGVAAPTQRLRMLQVQCLLVDTLYAGTTSMRNAAKLYLPQEPMEQDQMYIIRLNRTTLFNGLKRCIQQAVGKVFSEPVELGESADPLISLFCDDVDMQGRGINAHVQETFNYALRHGVSYLLVDYPYVGTEELTLEDERLLGARPYWVNIKLPQVLEIRTDRIRGVERCVMFRYLEIAEEFDSNQNSFGSRQIRQVKIYRLIPGATDEQNQVTFEIWRQDNSSSGGTGNWVIFQPATPVTPKFIPIVPFYTNRTGFMLGEPPLQDLAEKNLEHWRVSSDHAHILHFVGVPVYFGKLLNGGVSENGVPKPIIIAPNSLITGDAEGADLRVVEHSGAAVEAQRTQLKDIEDQMTVLGLELYLSRPGTVTATARAIDSAEQNSILKQMAILCQDALEQVLALTCDYLDLPEDAYSSVEVNTDFASIFRDTADAGYLFNLWDAGILGAADLVAEMKRRNILDDDFEYAGPNLLKVQLTPPAPAPVAPGSMNDMSNPDSTLNTASIT